MSRAQCFLYFATAMASMSGRAGVVNRDGSHGIYGQPFVSLGPNSTAVWEDYRKRYDTYFTPPTASVTAQDIPGTDRVLFDGLRGAYSEATGGSAYLAPGVMIGTAYSSSTYADAHPILWGCSSNGMRRGLDVRLGFMEHLASGGGASAASFVAQQGGEDSGRMDLFSGSWGVDGLYLHLVVDNIGSQWVVNQVHPSLIAAASPLDEGGRTNHYGNLNLEGLVDLGGGNFQLPDTSDMPLAVRWEVVHEGASTYADFYLGGSVRIRWLLDDSMAAAGLTTPGNSDGIGYQGGSLDLEHLVPTMFLGWADVSNIGDPQPAASLDLEIAGSFPSVAKLPSSIDSGTPAAFQITVANSLGQRDTAYVGSVHFASTDLAATLPADYTFTAADQGTHAFTVTLKTGGRQKLKAVPNHLDALAATQFIDVDNRLRVASSCSSSSGSSFWSLAALLLFARRGAWRGLRRVS